MTHKALVASIIKCLKQLLSEDELTADSRESLEVSIQCLESAYCIKESDTIENINLIELFKRSQTNLFVTTPENKAEAEKLKNEGNDLTKAEKYQEALINYTKAIELDGQNAVFYCNRAAVYNKLGNHQQAIKDCYTALSIDSSYSKAYGRLGLAYSNLNNYKEAKLCYEKALKLEPHNESLKNNLLIAEENLNRHNIESVNSDTPLNTSSMDLSSLLSNPALMNMARQMLADPAMQNMMSSLMSGNIEEGGRMDALIEAGQQLAQQMQNTNPGLIETLRRQVGKDSNNQDSSDK